MKLYKITDKKDQTYDGCQWGENITHETSGIGQLCGSGFTHWYTNPLLAILLNPIHGNYDLLTAHLWEGKGVVIKRDRGLKVGCTKATTIKQIPLPQVTLNQKIAFGILYSLEVYKEKTYVKWAKNWLDGKDRTEKSADAASVAAYAAVYAAANPASVAAYAANAAANAAVNATAAAAVAINTVKRGLKKFSLITIAKKAMQYT